MRPDGASRDLMLDDRDKSYLKMRDPKHAGTFAPPCPRTQLGWIHVEDGNPRAENSFDSVDIIDSSPLLIIRRERHKSVGSRRVDTVTVRCGGRLSVVDRLESLV